MAPLPGEIWFADVDPAPPARGHEQAGGRPALTLSNATYNAGPSGLVIVALLTSRIRRSDLFVVVDPPDGGLRTRSQVLCDQIRAIDRGRLLAQWGMVQQRTLEEVRLRVGGLLDI